MTAPPAGELEASRESRMVVIERGADGVPTVWCDPEIVDLVKALNVAGIRTVASCSGHGEQHGIISLKDGRELLIAPDYDTARKMERALLAALRLREWRPIESAPRNHSIVLIVDRFGRVGEGIVYEVNEAGARFGQPVGSVAGSFSRPDAWGDHNCKPTRWMPLPSPPTADDLARVLEESATGDEAGSA